MCIFLKPSIQDENEVFKNSRSPVGLSVQGYLHKVNSPSLKRLAILALVALLRPVPLHALALSVGGVLGGGAFLRCSCNPIGVLPSYPLLAGFLASSSLLPPLSGAFHGTCSGTGAVLALLRSAEPHTLALLCSALGRFLDLWYLTYQRFSWRC